MPFTAKYKNRTVDATDFPVDVWNELKASTEKHDLYCPDPDCGVQMIPKTYHRTGTQFFAHKHESDCPMSKGMTPEHLRLQNRVQKIARDAGWQAEKEVYLPELSNESKRYVDVLAISPDYPDSRIAFEIQWSHQTPERYIERTQSYINRGLLTYWISRKGLDNTCSDKGVCNWVISEDQKTVEYQSDALTLTLEDFVRKVLVSEPDAGFVNRCDFTKGFHFCNGLDCAIERGNAEHEVREAAIAYAMQELVNMINNWCYRFVTDNYLWTVLNHISKKEGLPDIRHVLENLHFEDFFSNKTPTMFGNESYPPPTLPKLCRWLWNSEKLFEKMTRTPAYDPRLDYAFWTCSCDWKHLEIGYRLFQGNKRTKNKPIRVNVVRCSACGAMHSGAGPHKKRVKQHLLHNAKRYELVSGIFSKKYRAKGEGYKGHEVHPDALIEAKGTVGFRNEYLTSNEV